MANTTPQAKDSPDDGKKDDGKKDGGKTEGNVGIVRATGDAAARASDGVRHARARLDEQISKQREQLTGKVRTLGRALRGAGEMLEEDNIVARGLHYTSDKVTHVADYIAELNPTVVVEDMRDIARRQPVWFFGGAFGLGLVLARFAKSTGASSDSSLTRPASATAELSRVTEASPRADGPKDATKRKSAGSDASSARAGTSSARSGSTPT